MKTHERLSPEYASGVTARPRRPRASMYALGVLGVLVGLIVRPVVSEWLRPNEAPAPQPPPTVQLPPVTKSAGVSDADVRRQAMLRAGPVLAWADAQSVDAIDGHVRAVNQFFRDAKRRTPAFAKDVLSFSSKWRLVSDKLPFTRSDRHAIYIRDTFGQRVFSAQQVAQALDQVVRNYVATESGIENQMLVRLRADVGDLPAGRIEGFDDPARLQFAFEQALAKADERVRADLRADLSRESVSLVVGTALQAVLVRLGVSAGILTAGAASSWETFGVGLVACIVVDQIVSWVWNWWRDPVGDLSGRVNEKLTELNVKLVDGDQGRPGLRMTLTEFAHKRAALRRAAVEQLINGGTVVPVSAEHVEAKK
jgi:hypothetical protein